MIKAPEKTEERADNVTSMKKYRRRVTGSRVLSFAKVTVILLILLAVSGTIYYFRDELTAENARIILSYFTPDALKKNESLPERVSFVTDTRNSYGIYKNRFVISSVDGVRMYSAQDSQEEYIPMICQKPVMQITDKFILNYDMGGNTLSVINNSSAAKTDTYSSSIITARMNTSGCFSVVTSARGYKALVRVFNSNMQEIYNWYSADNRVLDVDISPDNKRACIAVLNTQGTALKGGVTVLDMGMTEPVGSVITGDMVVIRAAYKDNDCICAVTDSALIYFDRDGERTGSYDFDGKYLRMYCSEPKDHTVVVLGRDSVQEDVTLLSISNKAEGEFSSKISDGVKAIAADDDKIVVVTNNRLLCMGYDGEIISQKPLDYDVRGVSLDGDMAYLITSSSAELINIKE